ncbi:MAG: S8 family serine peptidase [Bdellovibrionaceae bacterium]|nr:S8 family serine peptidase [Pseudobdellovibrionaceae bacterium]
MKLLQLVLVSFALLTLAGCKEEVDDQTMTPANAMKIVNPIPTQRNFRLNNQNHKVIVAAIDSGTDYNHPQMINNMHFNLDENGNPIGLGYDFIGQDYWPAPYVARTLDINPDADQKEAAETRTIRTQAAVLVKAYPQLNRYIDPRRNFEQEAESGAFHGTHVSALMVYDEPRIGLISYRVLPINIKYKNGREDRPQDKLSLVIANIMQAMALAVKSGARVINMSLALKSNSNDSIFSTLESDNDRLKKWMKQLQSFMNAHPHVVFVAAAGNDGQWVDDKANLQLPCGVSADNLVCVGALNAAGNLADFSNLVLSQATFVAANGVEIESARPTDMCESNALSYFKNEKTFSDESIARRLLSDCIGKKPMRTSSGTSMASPIVARVVAKLILENQNLSAQEIIKILVSKSEKIQLGPLLLNKIPFETPSWTKTKMVFIKP